ncbi:hypothetical protein HH311_20025 [Actinomycetospora sp. TBRC 11914]|nr:hypothetical protein [Actinomycetospora sp. TBRC 11914]
MVGVPARPGKPDVDPVLDMATLDRAGQGGRLVVVGTDADLAAVLVRLLRTERLEVPVAFVPLGPSVAATVWGLPPDGAAALDVARRGLARPAPLVRDDRGGVVAGEHVVGPFDGVVYCDEHEVLRGDAAGLVVRPDPAGRPIEIGGVDVGGVAVAVTGARRFAGLRRGVEHRGRGRAATLGCRPAALRRDGVDDDRPLERRSWYRHTVDWTLVRPAET